MRREEVIRLLGKQKRNFWELLSRWEYRLEDFVTTLNAMHAAGEVIVEDNCLQLSPALQATAPQTLEEGKCPACAGRGVVGTNSQLLQEFQRLLQERPLTTAKYFQGNMDAESVVARVHLMDMRDGLAGKRITLVGDDDYLSLALALTRLPTRIVVLEVDERIGAFLCRCRQQYDLPIEYIPYNVTDPLPPELREQSDLFSTEPLETLSGFLTFFARGAATLRAGGVGYVGLTTLECSLKKWKRIQEAILRMGFVITEIQRRFSDYPMEYPEDRVYVEQVIKSVRFPIKPEGKVWYFSHLFRVEAIEEITPVIPPQASTRIDLFDPGDDLTYPEGQVTES